MSADRPSHQCNDGVVTCALRGFLLVPVVLYSFDPPLHRSRSRAPPSGRVYCPFVFGRLSVVSLSSLLAFPLLRVLSLRLLSPVLTFHELQAAFLSHHTGPPTAPLLPRAAAVSPFTPSPPSVRISPSFRARFHSWSPTLSRNWSPGYVTRTKSAVRAAPLCLTVSRQDICCSGVTGPLASSPVASPLDLNRFSVFQKGGSRGKSRSIADSLHP